MNYKVFAAGRQIPVRKCKIFEKPYNEERYMEYVMLHMDDRLELEIESEIAAEEVIVRPLSADIPYRLENGKIYITVKKPAKLSVEINGSYENNLVVLVDRQKREEFVPDENTIVFGKGVHNTDTIIIDKDNTTLYLEDGAVINGNIIARDCRDLTICGYGMVCMEKYTYEMRKDFCRSIDVQNCRNVRISDITINDSNSWSLRLHGCDDVVVENVKIFGCRGNSDGIDVCGSRSVLVRDIFTRVWDDSFVVKALDTGNTENIVFKDSVLWNDFARPMEIGVELRADEVKNIRFENIDILHSTTGYPLMGIHHGDRARVSDVLFSNIRIEDTPGAQLFDIRITNSVWNEDDTMGDIRNVTFSDIKYIGGKGSRTLLSNSRIEGYSEENDIRNVNFHNIVINGRAVTSEKELGLDVRRYVSDVSVTSDIDAENAAVVSAEVCEKTRFALGKDGMYRGSVGVRLSNDNRAAMSGVVWLAVSPKNMEREAEIAYKLSPGETAEYEFDMCLQPGKYVFYLKSDNCNVENSWAFISLDALIVRNKKPEDCPLYAFRNYYNTDSAGVRMAVSEDKLFLLAELKDQASMDFVIYTAMPVPEREGEIVFSSEEVDFGEVCALIKDGDSLVAAPQLRCPAEITYVFENEPKVSKIYKNEITLRDGECVGIPLERLGVTGDEFIMEIEAKSDEVKKYRYPYTLFHSVTPESTAHMFGRIKITEEQ